MNFIVYKSIFTNVFTVKLRTQIQKVTGSYDLVYNGNCFEVFSSFQPFVLRQLYKQKTLKKFVLYKFI